MSAPMTKAERTKYNQAQHRAKRRQEAVAAYGARRGAELAWFDEARAVARAQEEEGNKAAANELIAALKNYCERYGK